MQLILAATVILLLGGIAALVTASRPRAASALAAVGAVIGAAVGLVPAGRAALTGGSEAIRCAWRLPLGEFHLALDALSGLFLIPILILTALAAVYGTRYLAHDRGLRVGVSWFFYSLLTAGMIIVVVARDAVLFLLAWEIMSLASFFLVAYDDRRESVRHAAWTYLVATHVGTAALIAMFVLLGRESGSFDFDRWSSAGLTPTLASLCFLLAVAGFGTKAGFIPLHVWLPEAHPAAPSHVSAVMSGVMIKTGIYGLMRIVSLMGPPPAWWGWVLVAVGLSSGILGVLFALAQHDLKRLLAYHSVENIGIIALGLGLGVLGTAYGAPVVATLGFTGALLHVVNHALFKGLLFLGAGSVLHASGTTEIDRLGGLIKHMPRTALAFLVGAVAICGLPPLNGFISELLIFLGALRGVQAGDPVMGATAAVVIAGLALIGGLAIACFTKAFGVIFLGEPRSSDAAAAREVAWPMTIPMVVLALGCLVIGMTAPWLIGGVLAEPLAVVNPAPSGAPADLGAAVVPLGGVIVVAATLTTLVVVLTIVRRRLLRGRTIGETGTWDCGYLRPAARMQYTASSFAQPLVELFRNILRPKREATPITDLFPTSGRLSTHAGDLFTDRLIAPVFRRVRGALGRFRWIQHGRVQLYVLYIAITLLVLLIWKLR
ncbi:MAG: hypothetical protein JXL80_05140 [Planctomycetes bacterium]|nr:hypothetical protein [Planctomycetota bacterium]